MAESEEKRREIERLVDVLVCSAMSADRKGCAEGILKVKESVTKALFRVADVGPSEDQT